MGHRKLVNKKGSKLLASLLSNSFVHLLLQEMNELPHGSLVFEMPNIAPSNNSQIMSNQTT
jgi:hypothetical protein